MRLSNKLYFTKLESFKIIKVLELVIYKLDLPDSYYDQRGTRDITYLVQAFTKS